jgi:hypothetical protein
MSLHDAIKVLLGSTRSSFKVVTEHSGNPATFLAGLAVSRTSGDSLSLAASAGKRIGISAGKSLSDHSRTAVIRKGLGVPLIAGNAYGVVTITSYANLVNSGDDEITVGEVTFVAQSGAATPGEATFRAASSNDATATSLAAQINAHEDLDGVVVATVVSAAVHIRAVDAGAAGEEIALTYSDEGTATVGATVTGSGTLIAVPSVAGQPVYVDTVLGTSVYSSAANAAITNAVYANSARITGVNEAGAEVDVVIVDMPGGL